VNAVQAEFHYNLQLVGMRLEARGRNKKPWNTGCCAQLNHLENATKPQPVAQGTMGS
jgi:hypothetical protein